MNSLDSISSGGCFPNIEVLCSKDLFAVATAVVGVAATILGILSPLVGIVIVSSLAIYLLKEPLFDCFRFILNSLFSHHAPPSRAPSPPNSPPIRARPTQQTPRYTPSARQTFNSTSPTATHPEPPPTYSSRLSPRAAWEPPRNRTIYVRPCDFSSSDCSDEEEGGATSPPPIGSSTSRKMPDQAGATVIGSSNPRRPQNVTSTFPQAFPESNVIGSSVPRMADRGPFTGNANTIGSSAPRQTSNVIGSRWPPRTNAPIGSSYPSRAPQREEEPETSNAIGSSLPRPRKKRDDDRYSSNL